MAMKSLALAILLATLFASNCEGKGLGRRVIGLPARIGKRDLTEKVFNVLSFGAKPGGRIDSSEGFMQTWLAACHWKGKARMLIPQGVFLIGPVVFTGPCASRSPIIVQFLGTVKALPDPTSYEEDFWMQFQDVNGLIVTGTGTIDGQGADAWQYNNCGSGGSNCGSFPSSLKLYRVTSGIVRQINSVNPMGFHIAIVLCENIRARNLHLTAPQDSPNTDGIHISQSNMVKVARSVIATGDDCVGIIQGSTDISIKKVTCGPGHGISVGSLGKYPNEKDVKGLVVKNCTFKGTENGIRIKTWGGSPPSQASSMFFDDLVMEGVKNPIIIDQNYGSKSKGPSRVKISDVHYTNIRGTTTTPVAVSLTCSQSNPCDRIELSNINLRYVGANGQLPMTSSCANTRPIYTGVQFPPVCR